VVAFQPVYIFDVLERVRRDCRDLTGLVLSAFHGFALSSDFVVNVWALENDVRTAYGTMAGHVSSGLDTGFAFRRLAG
jgi:hypothetical protein